MAEQSRQKDLDGEIRKLSDPDFFALWACLRDRLFCVPKGKPEHCEIKRRYEDAAAEYRRRVSQGIAMSHPEGPEVQNRSRNEERT